MYGDIMNQTELFTEVRVQIKDSVGTPRWPNSNLRTYAQAALDILYDDHPEAFMEDTIVITRPLRLTGSNEGTDMGVTVSFQFALVHYVAGSAMLEDREHAGNVALGTSHLAQWAAMIG